MRYEWEDKIKKCFAVFLVFSILALSGNLYSNEEKGVELAIQKKDGQVVKGELIVVKESSLLLMGSVSGADVTVLIIDISEIRVVKKSKALIGGRLGLIVGVFAGAVVASISKEPLDSSQLHFGPPEEVSGAMVVGLLGFGIGAAIGAIVGTDKYIQVEGKTDSEIAETLEYLRKRARIPAYN